MPIWLLPLMGAAAGAMMNRKNPLKGALMGGALGAGGGMLAGAGAAAAPAVGSWMGAGGAGTATSLASGFGAGTGLGSTGIATGIGSGSWMGAGPAKDAYLAAQAAGISGANAAAGGAVAPTTGTGFGGLLGNMKQYADPAMNVMNAANTAKSLMASDEQQLQPQPLDNEPLNVSGLIQEADARSQLNAQEAIKRRQQMQQYMSNIG